MGFVKGQIVKVAKMYDKFVDKLSDYPWGIIEHADENGKVWVKMLEDCGNPSYVPASKLIAAPYVPHYFKPGDLVGFINYSGLRPVAIRNANIIGGTVIKINKDTLTLGFGNIDETLTVNKDDCFWTGYPLINRYGLREGELEKGAWVPKKK